MTTADMQVTLLDRDSQRSAIDRALRTIRGGFSAALVLRGGPGAGKSALLRYAMDAAPDMLIRSVTGVETEIDLDFAALHQLLIPFLAEIEDLPGPQRQAIRAAFGMQEGPPADRFLVGLATLTLLSQAAESQPVLCVVDDAEWMDAESAQALAFVVRRLYADRVGMFASVGDRSLAPTFDQFAVVSVADLPTNAAMKLLHSVAAGPVDDQVAGRLLADTERNPLGLVEAASALSPAQLAGRAPLPEPMPVSQDVAERFCRQIADLDPDTRAFLVLVAADTSGELDIVRAAARQGGIDADNALRAAESVRLIEMSATSVRFRHPLIRSAVYTCAPESDRRRAHELLSGVADAGQNADSRAWHRASATVGPDEGAASDLEEAAQRAYLRGGYAARAALLHRALALTADDNSRVRREIELADAEFENGESEAARDLVDEALPRMHDARGRMMAERLRGEILFTQGQAAESAAVLSAAAREIPPDKSAARETMLAALEASMWAGPDQVRKTAAAASGFVAPAGSPASASDLLLEGYRNRFTVGYAQCVPPLQDAIRAFLASDQTAPTHHRWGALTATAAWSLWDEQGMLDVTDLWLRSARAQGALTEMPAALGFRAGALWIAGQLAQAEDSWAEMRELIAASRGPSILGVDSMSQGLVQLYTGHPGAARAAGVAQVKEATARGQGGPADIGRYIIARADLAAGHPEGAVTAAQPAVEANHAGTAEMALPEFIAAACRARDRELAKSGFEELSRRTQAAGTHWAHGIRCRCAALFEDGDRADDLYQEAIDHLERSRAVIYLARTLFQYGEWLRRAKRRRDARQPLRAAFDMYDQMGARDFAYRAAAELRATGEHARTRSAASADSDLTPQEGRVARLAAEGATNKDIAGQLFISASTVEYHLGKVFRKLGVTSRTQLARRILVGDAQPA